MSDCCSAAPGFPTAGQMEQLALAHPTIWQEICAIQQAILSAASQCQPEGGKMCTVVGGNTPMTFTGGVRGVNVLSPGAGYLVDTPNIRIIPPVGAEPVDPAAPVYSRSVPSPAGVFQSQHYFGRDAALHGGIAYIASPAVDQLVGTPGQVYRIDTAGMSYSADPLEQGTTLTGGAGYALFGWSVAVNTASIAVSSLADSTAGNAGLVELYSLTDGSMTASFANPEVTLAGHDKFGWDIAITDSVLVASSLHQSADGVDVNSLVHVFDLATNTLTYTIGEPAATQNTNFGYSVAVSDTDVFVGVPTADGGITQSRVDMFDLGTGDYVKSFYPTDAANLYFGSAISVSGNTLAVGSPFEVVGAGHIGRTYLFDIVSGDLERVVTCPEADIAVDGEYFGSSVALDGHALVVGATKAQPLDTDNASKCYVYNLLASDAVPARPLVEATTEVIYNGGSILGVTVVDGGSGYQPVHSTLAVSTSTGMGAEVAPYVNALGEIIGVEVINGGVGYTTADAIYAVRALPLHPAYTDARIRVAAVSSTGRIITAVVDHGGTGYEPSVSTVEVVSTLSPDKAYPHGMGFSASVFTDASGRITGIDVTNAGTGYSQLYPKLVVSDTGTGLTTRVNVLNGFVTSVTVESPGMNYTGSATAAIINPDTATSAPTEPASVVLDIPTNTFGTTPVKYYNVWSGSATDKQIQLQLSTVRTYFERLGYTVVIRSNPDTGNTIQWKICW